MWRSAKSAIILKSAAGDCLPRHCHMECRPTSVTGRLGDTIRLIADDVRSGMFAGCGHSMLDEASCIVSRRIVSLLGC